MNDTVDKKTGEIKIPGKNPIQEANEEAIESQLPFASCRQCNKYRICPIPSMSNTNMMVPEPHKCWLETMKNDPNGRNVLVKMMANAQNRYGLLLCELDSLESTIDLISETLDNASRISLHSAGALNAVKNRMGRRFGKR